MADNLFDKLERVLKVMAPGRQRDGFAIGQPVLNQQDDPDGGSDLYSVIVVSEDFIRAYFVVSKREVDKMDEDRLLLNLTVKCDGAIMSIASCRNRAAAS